MALKDWKKTSYGNYKKGNRMIEIYTKHGYFEVMIEKSFGQIRETFKSKSQALKFAKSYMRNH